MGQGKRIRIMEIVDKNMVSIIMLSCNGERFVEETVHSVLAQTYQNWRLIFIDDNSSDETIAIISRLKEEDRQKRIKETESKFEGGKNNFYAEKVIDNAYKTSSDKIVILRSPYTMGNSNNMNSALKDIQGRWVAFLNVGDVWAPDKLEKQIAFMEEHGYAFSYTNYGLMDMESRNRGVVVSGKAHVTHEDMLKCCWPAYMTVMYDREKVGEMKVRASQNNDYALWLKVSNRHDCYLLDENLATMRTKCGRLGRILLTDKLKWRYDAYRYDEGLGCITSLLYTIRNGGYGIVKWMRYVKRTK